MARVLLIAYEFPPSPSPQSLRWAYLARELALAGNQVHVLAPEHPGDGAGMPVLPATVTVHRTFAGPVMGILNSSIRRRRAREESSGSAGTSKNVGDGVPPPAIAEQLNWKGRVWHVGLNWKGRIFEALKGLAAILLFPDSRTEWLPWARHRLFKLLKQIHPDVVISSHEPAMTLRLGLLAKSRGYRWFADLGDPVLAPYTPRRWHRRAMSLEAKVCAQADHVLVTTSAAAQLLSNRHGGFGGQCSVLTQGFDGRRARAQRGASASLFEDDKLELLYTGSFYSFRKSGELLAAVAAVPGVRLNIASVVVPEDVIAASRRAPQSVRLLGFLRHTQALELQQLADVVVNIANEDPCQVPGKLFEYFGSQRPILHLASSSEDASAGMILMYRRGWVCDNEAMLIATKLKDLKGAHQHRRLEVGLDLGLEQVSSHDWRSLGSKLSGLISTSIQQDGACHGGN